nr:uncharacterized protein LOC122321340 [Drosophila bipectinata]
MVKKKTRRRTAGHLDVRKTIARVAVRYFWPGMQRDIRKYVRSSLAEALRSSSGSLAPYTPQENPTERVNRTVKTMIAQFARKDQRTWDEHWPELMLAVNSAVSESTGYSPCFGTQGREPRRPQALFALGTGVVPLGKTL